jgi:hypothetical protein
MILEHLEGKLAECPKCKKQFIVMSQDVEPNDPMLTCPDCLTGEYHLTLEGRNELLQELAVQDIQKTYNDRFKALDELRDNLTRKEIALTDREKVMRAKQNLLDTLILEVKEEKVYNWHKYLDLCKSVKLKEQRIALRLRERKSKLAEARAKFAEEQRAKQPKPVEFVEDKNVQFTNEQIGNSILLQLEKIVLDKPKEEATNGMDGSV